MSARRRPTALLLAAGAGSRLGRPKALIALSDGRTFLRALADTFQAAGCDVLVVVGAQAARVLQSHPDLRFVTNRRWRQGMFGSVRCGLRVALAQGAPAVYVHPVDAPTVRARTVVQLRRALRGHDAVVPLDQGRPGHPLLLSAAAAERVLRLRGAPHLLAAQQMLDVRRLETKDPGVCLNVNTPRALERLLST